MTSFATYFAERVNAAEFPHERLRKIFPNFSGPDRGKFCDAVNDAWARLKPFTVSCCGGWYMHACSMHAKGLHAACMAQGKSEWEKTMRSADEINVVDDIIKTIEVRWDAGQGESMCPQAGATIILLSHVQENGGNSTPPKKKVRLLGLLSVCNSST
jgi:hypothetical protein